MVPPQDAGRWYKRATAVVCACNLITVFCIIYVLFITSSSSLSASRVLRHELQGQGPRLTLEEAARYQASVQARRAVEPLELIKRVREIREELSRAELGDPKSEAARKKYAAAISERLKQLKQANATKNQRGENVLKFLVTYGEPGRLVTGRVGLTQVGSTNFKRMAHYCYPLLYCIDKNADQEVLNGCKKLTRSVQYLL